VIFESRADDLFAVVEIFGTNEADHGVHQHGMEGPRDRIGAGFERLLVDAMMRVRRESRALAGLEVHHVIAGHSIGAARATLEFACGLVRFGQQREVHAEASVSLFGSGNRLKDKIDRRSRFERGHLRGDVREHAALNRDVEALAQRVDHPQQPRGGGHVVAGGVDPITASPEPSSSPSRIDAAIPIKSSVG